MTPSQTLRQILKNLKCPIEEFSLLTNIPVKVVSNILANKKQNIESDWAYALWLFTDVPEEEWK